MASAKKSKKATKQSSSEKVGTTKKQTKLSERTKLSAKKLIGKKTSSKKASKKASLKGLNKISVKKITKKTLNKNANKKAALKKDSKKTSKKTSTLTSKKDIVKSKSKSKSKSKVSSVANAKSKPNKKSKSSSDVLISTSAKRAGSKAKKSSSRASKKSPSADKNTGQIPLEMEHWPKDRELVWNPERSKYLQGPRPKSCVFCAAASYEIGFKSLCLYQGAGAQVVLNKYPYHTGHIMVMPSRHVADLENLEQSEYEQIMNLIRSATVVLKKVYNCEGINIGINLGKAAGAGIPGHLHWHIIPRWSGDTNFFPAIAKARVISESLQDTYNKLLPFFREESKKSGLPGASEGSQVEFKL